MSCLFLIGFILGLAAGFFYSRSKRRKKTPEALALELKKKEGGVINAISQLAAPKRHRGSRCTNRTPSRSKRRGMTHGRPNGAPVNWVPAR